MKKKWKTTLIGGILGFLMPWFYFFYISTTCTGSHCGEIGMVTPFILFLSIATFIICAIIFFIIFKIKEKKLFFLLILLPLLTAAAQSYEYAIENQTNGNFTAQYNEITAQREFIFDAPHLISSTELEIPILFLIRDADNNPYSFYSIKKEVIVVALFPALSSAII